MLIGCRLAVKVTLYFLRADLLTELRIGSGQEIRRIVTSLAWAPSRQSKSITGELQLVGVAGLGTGTLLDGAAATMPKSRRSRAHTPLATPSRRFGLFF